MQGSPSKAHKQQNRKSVGQILAQGLKNQSNVDYGAQSKLSDHKYSQVKNKNIKAEQCNILINKTLNHRISNLSTTKQTQSRNMMGQNSSKTLSNAGFVHMENRRLSTANGASSGGANQSFSLKNGKRQSKHQEK